MNQQSDLKQRLSDEQGEVRAAALAELLQSGADVLPYINEVAARIGDPMESVRLMALQLLAKIGAPAAEYFTLALSRQQTDGFRAVAAAMLAAMGPPPAGVVRGLCRCLISMDATLRNAATVSLAKIGATAVPSLRLVLPTSSPEAVAAAVDALAMIGRSAEAAGPELQALSVNSPLQLQLACAAAISRVTGDPERGLPVLVNALENRDPLIRKTAIEKMALLGAAAHPATPQLLRCTADPDESVRVAALLTLGRIRAPHAQVVPGIAARMGDPDGEVRYAAAVVLAGYGARARPALAILQTCLQDPLEKVARCVAGAIKMIESSNT